MACLMHVLMKEAASARVAKVGPPFQGMMPGPVRCSRVLTSTALRSPCPAPAPAPQSARPTASSPSWPTATAPAAPPTARPQPVGAGCHNSPATGLREWVCGSNPCQASAEQQQQQQHATQGKATLPAQTDMEVSLTTLPPLPRTDGSICLCNPGYELVGTACMRECCCLGAPRACLGARCSQRALQEHSHVRALVERAMPLSR